MAQLNDEEISLCKRTFTDYCKNKIENLKKIKHEGFNCRYNRGLIMTEEERLQLLNWSINIMPITEKLRFRRLAYFFGNDKSNVIDLVFEIKKRIEEKEQLSLYEEESKLKHFIGYIFPGGKIHKHTDTNDEDRKLYHIRYNVFLLDPNLNTYYDNNILDSSEGTYALCRSGIDYHWTITNDEVLPRISLSFGYMVPKWKLDELLPEK
jgi:hypothetical protein